VEAGLKIARSLLVELVNMGLPLATEALGPISRFSRVITDNGLKAEHQQKLQHDGLIVDIVKKPT
jgi:phospho-2-dehydro-3-deoxyheptonate aldolase